jgi:hypothetical protein
MRTFLTACAEVNLAIWALFIHNARLTATA